MKKVIIIIICLAGFWLNSCSDIVNSDKNVITVYGAKNSGLSPRDKNIYFKFDLYFLDYELNDTTIAWQITKPSTFGRTFNAVSKNTDNNYLVNSIRLLDGRYFELTALSELPYVLEPNKVSNLQEFLITLKTTDLEPGIYIDKIYINNNPDIGYYIRVNVN